MSTRVLTTALALLIGGFAPAAATQDVRDTIAEVPVIAGHPGQSYMVYLPRDYSAQRSWPILYVLDPRARGRLGAEIFQGAAEEYGYIIASSNNSHSDVPKDPNIPSVNAMWADTHARFKIDPRRTYIAGFSGTFRAAVYLARHVPAGSFAGIIGAGAGYPPDMTPNRNDRFALYLTVGKRDFNFLEVMELEPKLRRAGIAHHVEIFEGVHQWPPAELRLEAIEWMELQAMKSGARRRDEAWLESLWQKRMERARAAEASGEKRQANRILKAAREDFAGLVNLDPGAR